MLIIDYIRRVRYREGYEKGIHDHDAAAILRAFLPLRNAAGTLRHSPSARALAVAWWCRRDAAPQETTDRIRAARAIDTMSPAGRALQAMRDELAATIVEWIQHGALPFPATEASAAAAFLLDTITSATPTFRFTHYADALVTAFRARLSDDAGGSVLASALQRV